MHPTNNPIITEEDFMMGDPTLSQIRMVTNTENPRPTNSALPHGRACGASTVGQYIKRPESGLDIQSPEPPSHPLNPLSISEIPINMTVGPDTIGGKTFWIIFAGMKEIRTKTSAQQALVPTRAP